jgi:hypothetical protein
MSLFKSRFYSLFSGGGLYAYDSTISRFVVVGITSYGYACALAGYPG